MKENFKRKRKNILKMLTKMHLKLAMTWNQAKFKSNYL